MGEDWRPLRDEVLVRRAPVDDASPIYTGPLEYESCVGRVIAMSATARRHLGPAGVDVGDTVVWEDGMDLPLRPGDAEVRRVSAAEVLGVVE